MNTRTIDTAEAVTVPGPPARDPWGEGYDWIDQLRAPWRAVPAWGREGYDLGSWPYIVFAQATAADAAGALHGYCTYVEGDLSTHWFRTAEARNHAISKEAFWYWASGQADGPQGLPTRRRTVRAVPGSHSGHVDQRRLKHHNQRRPGSPGRPGRTPAPTKNRTTQALIYSFERMSK